MASNNEYKVKVGVEFNAQMSEINSQIDQLKDKITKLGSATGDKSLAEGLNKDIQEITTKSIKTSKFYIQSIYFQRLSD